MRFSLRGRRPGIWRHLAAQRQPLRHTKPVLLVNDGEAQVLELHLVLDDRVGSNHQTGFTTGDQRQHLAPLLCFLAACEPGRFDAQWLQPGDQFAEMLFGQDLGGRHQRTLPARVNADGSGQRCDHGFAGTHIAL